MTPLKRLALVVLSVIATTSSLHANEQTLLQIDFSDYGTDQVISAGSDGHGYSWAKGAAWVGKVVATPGAPTGSKALSVRKTAGGSPGRGSVNLSSSLSLASSDKIYWAFDLNLQDTTSNIELAFSNGSFGTPSNLGFGIRVTNASSFVQFYSSASTSVGVTDTALKLSTNTWYRFELEISQGATAGVGTYTVYVSSEDSPTRSPLLSNVAYSFTSGAQLDLKSLNLVPLSIVDDGNAMLVNNLVVKSGLDSFPVNPIPEASSVAYLALGAVGFIAVAAMRRSSFAR